MLELLHNLHLLLSVCCCNQEYIQKSHHYNSNTALVASKVDQSLCQDLKPTFSESPVAE